MNNKKMEIFTIKIIIGIILITLSINFSIYGTPEGTGLAFGKITGTMFIIGFLLLLWDFGTILELINRG